MDRVLPFRFAEEEGVFWLLDQRRLPQEEVYVPVHTWLDTPPPHGAMPVQRSPAARSSA